MDLHSLNRSSAHLCAGCGGDIHGLKRSHRKPRFAVELNSHRCKTLRINHPELQVLFEGPIQSLTLSCYPQAPDPILFYFATFPCDHYTVAANIHQKWTGDAIYREAVREIILHYLECIVVEIMYNQDFSMQPWTLLYQNVE